MAIKQPNYLEESIRLAAKLGPGMHHIDVAHDDWCAIWRGRACDCRPDVKVRKRRWTGSPPRARRRKV